MVGYFFTVTTAVSASCDTEVSNKLQSHFQASAKKLNNVETVFFEIDEKEEEESERLSLKKQSHLPFFAIQFSFKALLLNAVAELSSHQFTTHSVNAQPTFLLLRVLRL